MSNKAEIAYWIKKENIDSYWFVCSKCGEESGFSPITPDYCPHCHRKINGIMYEDGTIVSRYQALEWRLNDIIAREVRRESSRG